MTYETIFMKLVADLRGSMCEKEDLEVPSGTSALSYSLRADDVSFVLFYDTAEPRPDFLLLCEMGRLPTHDRDELLRGLLETNLINALHGGPVIGLQYSGEIVHCIQRIPLSFPLDAVMAAIDAGAREARRWRERHLVEAPHDEVARLESK